MPNPEEIVDSYTLAVRERDGFSFVVVRFLTQDSKAHTFELHPAFAHHLSDEVLRTVVAAAPKQNHLSQLAAAESNADEGAELRRRATGAGVVR